MLAEISSILYDCKRIMRFFGVMEALIIKFDLVDVQVCREDIQMYSLGYVNFKWHTDTEV